METHLGERGKKRRRRKGSHLTTADATLDFKVLPKRLGLTGCKGLGPATSKGGPLRVMTLGPSYDHGLALCSREAPLTTSPWPESSLAQSWVFGNIQEHYPDRNKMQDLSVNQKHLCSVAPTYSSLLSR